MELAQVFSVFSISDCSPAVRLVGVLCWHCRNVSSPFPRLVAEDLELRPREVVEVPLHPESIVISPRA